MKLISLLKKNNFIFFILKNIQRLLKNVLKKIFIFSGLDDRLSTIENSLVYKYLPENFNWEKYCLNGQEFRRKIVTEVLKNIKFRLIVETGTEYGFTTKFFSDFSSKVISIEKSKPMFTIARKNLQNEENIQLILNDSKNLKSIIDNENTKIDKDESTFFYLDAHSDDDYPLIEEIKYILEEFSNSIILIDDFHVPYDNGYGFDSYRGKKLNLEFIKDLFTKNENVFFPNIPSFKETGRLRGYIIITNNTKFNNFLNNITELSSHKF